MPMVDVEGTSLFYTVKGEGGVPIIFIHPPLLTSENFVYQKEVLSQKFKVLTFDIRGHGRSNYSPHPITYPLIVEDMRILLDHLGIEKTFVCGYSTGGSIGLEFLLTYPERALGGIVISGMSEVSDWYTKQRIKLATNLAKRRTFSMLSFAITWGNANKQEIFKRMNRAALKGDPRNIEQYYRYSNHYNCSHLLHTIKLPVLLVYGKKDKTFHQYANLLHKELPNNVLKFLNKEKHQLPTKAACELNQLIEQFIESNI